MKPAFLLIACSLILLPVASATSHDVIASTFDELPADCFSTTDDIKPVDRWDDEYQQMADCLAYHYTGSTLPARIDVDATPDPYLHDPDAQLECAVYDLHEIVTSWSRGCGQTGVFVQADHGLTTCYVWYDGKFGCYSAPEL